MADDEVRITLRMPADLRDRIAKAAERTKRSMNSEIVSLLESAVWESEHMAERVAQLSAGKEKRSLGEHGIAILQGEIDKLSHMVRQIAEDMRGPDESLAQTLNSPVKDAEKESRKVTGPSGYSLEVFPKKK